MEDINNYSEFTEERYKALYDRIYIKQEKFISEWTDSSRDPNKGYEYATMLYSAFLSFKTDELLKEAIDAFDFAYPLWHTMPQLMETVEPIRLKMLEKYYPSEIPQPIDTKIKTVQRFKLFGIIPFLPKIQEVYSAEGELLRRNHFALDFSKSKLEQLGNAKNKEEKDLIGMSLYRLERVEGVKPIEISGMGISGEPTRKRLFQAIVKHRAIHDYFNHLRVSDATNYKKLTELYKESIETIESNIDLNAANRESQEPDAEPLEVIEGSKKRQAIAYYYLLTAGNVKGILSNKSEFARFIAFMSGYELQGNGKAKNIYNTSFYRIVKQLFGQKTMDFSDDDLDAVVQSFQMVNNGEDSLLTRAIEKIKEDRKV